MPELPDVVVYIEALEARIRGARLERVRLASPFVLRSVNPPLATAQGAGRSRVFAGSASASSSSWKADSSCSSIS